MKLSPIDALDILDIKSGVVTPERVKAAYRKMCSINHPDRGGDTHKMQLINIAYKLAKDFHGRIRHANEPKTDPWHIPTEKSRRRNKIINELAIYPNIHCEEILDVLWISGNTYPLRDILKALKCRWDPTVKKWYSK